MGQFGVALSGDLLGRGQQRGQAVAVFDQVLLPANQVHVAQQHFDFAPHQQGFKRRVFDVDVGNVDFFDTFVVVFDVRQHSFYVFQLPLHRQRKRRHSAFHALEHVDAQQVNQAFFPVGLPKKALAAPNLGAVFGVVGGLLVQQHIAQRRVAGQVQAANL